jgi:large repetitive protein
MLDAIVAQGGGDRIQIGLIPHQTDAVIEDMDPSTPGLQPYTTALADKDNNGVPDIKQILQSYTPGSNNNFTNVMEKMDALLSLLPSLSLTHRAVVRHRHGRLMSEIACSTTHPSSHPCRTL